MATQEVAALTPKTRSEPLWDIGRPIVVLLDWLRKCHVELLEHATKDTACEEAASLVSEWLAAPRCFGWVVDVLGETNPSCTSRLCPQLLAGHRWTSGHRGRSHL